MIECVLLDGTKIEIQSLKDINEKKIATQIKELYCDNTKLKTLEGLDQCVNLQELVCENNKLETLEGLEECVNLHILECHSNKLTTLKGLKCLNLQRLNCHSNKLETLEGIEKCAILHKLWCFNNQLGEFDGNIIYMINGNEYKITKELLKYDKLYTRMTKDEMDEYYDYLDGNEHIIIANNYNNFIRSEYFEDHKKEFVEKYNLVEYYDEIYLITQNTEDNCSICINDTFKLYIRCVNGHVICKECYELCQNKRLCCVCRVEYDIKNMYYSKN